MIFKSFPKHLLTSSGANKFICPFSSKAGHLYTWGRNKNSLGYNLPPSVVETNDPKKLPEFDGNVVKVSMGLYHSAAITDKGELYTWGYGSYGCLGHNEGDKNHVTPKLVEFFSKNNLKVKDVAMGESHTVALTDDGDVWTWGYGGRKTNFLINLFFSSIGSLGHGSDNHRYTPTPVEFLRNLPPIVSISSGYTFTLAMNVNKEVYNWGRGDYGVFGDGNNKSLLKPSKNTYFDRMREVENLTIKKIKSCNNYTVALMSDGNLYGWGSNEAGQMGIKNEIGVELYETANFPTPIVNEDFADKKIVDFDIGEDIMAILLNSNEVFWSGIRIAYKPERLKLPKDIGKIKKVACCFKCVVVVTENGEIFMKNNFVKHEKENIETGILSASDNLFEGGKIIDIGGVYRNRYAIVKH